MAFAFLNAEMLSWSPSYSLHILLALPTKAMNDIVFRFIVEYILRDFGLKSIFSWGFLKDDILACVETWD
jgi:hypothetical protein